MKILFGYLTQQYRGGTKFQLDFARHFDRVEVGFVTSNAHVEYEEMARAIGPIHVIPPTKKVFARIRALSALAQEYDIIYLNKAALNPIENGIIRRAGFKRVVYHSHSTSKESGNPIVRFLYTAMHRLSRVSVSRSADKLYACSDAAGRWLFGDKNADRFTVVNNGIEVERYRFDPSVRARVREELGLSGRVVLHVGAFMPVKNQAYLIEAFSHLHADDPDTTLLLVGDGALASEAKQQVESLGLTDSVRFLGYRNDVDKLMQAADIFVLPSLFEGLPFVAIEAQAAGLPCVITASSTPQVQITDVCELFDVQRPAEELAVRMREWLCVERCDTADAVIAAGFDLKNCVKSLEDELYNL